MMIWRCYWYVQVDDIMIYYILVLGEWQVVWEGVVERVIEFDNDIIISMTWMDVSCDKDLNYIKIC